MVRDGERFPRAALHLAATFDIGCALYFAVPTAPPWWASAQGLTGGEVRRIMTLSGERTWGAAWPALYRAAGDGDPWAAMPSLHLRDGPGRGDGARRDGWGGGGDGMGLRAHTLGFALLYLGEHYLTDLAVGALLSVAVRRGGAASAPWMRRALAALSRRRVIAGAAGRMEAMVAATMAGPRPGPVKVNSLISMKGGGRPPLTWR